MANENKIRAYRPITAVKDWLQKVESIDLSSWEALPKLRDEYASVSEKDFQKAFQIAKRAAAFETGAIEGLYESDRGLTFTVASQAAMWEAKLEQRQQRAKALFESQLAAYDSVLDFATNARPLSAAWIRELHAQLCGSQDEYTVETSNGPEKRPLPKGRYKTQPNHVLKTNKEIHEYAPPELVAQEMDKLVEQLRSPEFIGMNPILQAVYAHYYFVSIHPFADGNGRVARALASVYTYRDASLPLLIHHDDRTQYFDALEQADDGDFLPLCRFFLRKARATRAMVETTLRAASVPNSEEASTSLYQLYYTKSGFSPAQVNQAAQNLERGFRDALEEQRAESFKDHPTIICKISRLHDALHARAKSFTDVRKIDKEISRGITVHLETSEPVAVATGAAFVAYTQKLPSDNETITLFSEQTNASVTAEIQELIPEIDIAAAFRFRIEADLAFGAIIQSLKEKVRAKMLEEGYLLEKKRENET